MSNAKATIESSIILGLSENADKHPFRLNHATVVVPNIIDAIFASSVRWAIAEYLKELEAKEHLDD